MQWAGTSALVKLPPEIDISNAGTIGDDLRAALWQDALSVFVDMSTTRFCDCAGVSALIGAYLLAQARQAKFRLVFDAPAVHRIFELTGAGQFLEIHPTMSSALACEQEGDLAACPPRGADPPPGGPPVREPLAQHPLAQVPSAENPLAQVPSAENPLAQESPALEPLAQEPPAQVPPAAPSLPRRRCARACLPRRPAAARGCIWRWGRAACSQRGRGQAPGYRRS